MLRRAAQLGMMGSWFLAATCEEIWRMRWISLVLALVLGANSIAAERLNLLVITVDDMSADSIGAFGCKLAGTSPNVDQLGQGGNAISARARAGRQLHALAERDVVGPLSAQQPRRRLLSGPESGYPVLVDLMKRAGYFTGIRGKVAHSTPYSPYGWDVVLDTLPDGHRRIRRIRPRMARRPSAASRARRRRESRFALIINIMDPHKPFYAEGRERRDGPRSAQAVAGLYAGGSADSRLSVRRSGRAQRAVTLLLLRAAGG